MTVNEYFNRIVLITMARRLDRFAKCVKQFDQHGFKSVTVFEGHDMGDLGNHGCTASHRGVLELICHNRWARTLILEDDFQIRAPNFNQLFAEMIGEVPDDWKMLYLGGHYAENPKRKAAPHVIEINRMLTTSSYAVTCSFAREVTPWISGGVGIDTLYYPYHLKGGCYIFKPRLMVQSPGYSDLQKMEMNNTHCMEDTSHENSV